jgi:hypothetical protein
MSIKQKIEENVQAAKNIAAHNVLTKIIVAVTCGMVGVIATFLNDVFDIDAGIALTVSALFILSAYIVYKIKKYRTKNAKKAETLRQTICKNCAVLTNKGDKACFNCRMRVQVRGKNIIPFATSRQSFL